MCQFLWFFILISFCWRQRQNMAIKLCNYKTNTPHWLSWQQIIKRWRAHTNARAHTLSLFLANLKNKNTPNHGLFLLLNTLIIFLIYFCNPLFLSPQTIISFVNNFKTYLLTLTLIIFLFPVTSNSSKDGIISFNF